MTLMLVNRAPKTAEVSQVNADSIQALREQILANAATLYPQIMADSRAYKTMGTAHPSQVFEVILVGPKDQMRGVLVYGDTVAKHMAARGPPADTAEKALRGLLHVISEALGWYTETLLGELERPEECSDGVVNFDLVEDGFHFAAYNRWVR